MRPSALFLLLLLLVSQRQACAVPGPSRGPKPPSRLTLASWGRANASVWVRAEAGEWERRAAEDLVSTIRRMTGASLPLIVADEHALSSQPKDQRLRLVVGELALRWQPGLRTRLAAVAKKNPVLRADAVVLRRIGNTVYLAGNNDDSHYYAVSTLLHRWGCRWYLPTDFGECIPSVDKLTIGPMDFAYGSPFEVRRYWISWNGSNEGKAQFMRRNFFNEVQVPSGHALGEFTKELVPPGKNLFQVPIAESATADHVARRIEADFAAGKDISLGMEDGVYESDSPLDSELFSLRYDKYFLKPSATDAFLTLYNGVARRLRDAHPRSTSRIGFLAYANMTLPPVRVQSAEGPLVAYLAPIDIDPIHPMESPLSAPRREYRGILRGWAKVMRGRVVVYDYDQSMMVWRDIPAPSLQMFHRDVKQYLDAGILGVDTESRGAFATTFTNLHYRGQLLWNPDADVTAMENRFYRDFFGPGSESMQRYWSAIYKAWSETIVTEHEIHIFPAIYSSSLMQGLRRDLERAKQAVAPIARRTRRSVREDQVLRRMDFMTRCFGILEAYYQMNRAATLECDYATAVRHGERGLAVREELTRTGDIFTSYKRIGENGAAWWPGEVEQYRRLGRLIDGQAGRLVQLLPARWLFRIDPGDAGLAQQWAERPIAAPPPPNQPVDWRDVRQQRGDWQWLLTSQYVQSQGIFDDLHQSYAGIAWYRVECELPGSAAAGRLRLMFPGLFNQAKLFVNGKEVATRTGYQAVWWLNSYEFEWDVDVTGFFRPGRNTIALRIDNPHHMGGMFRRPFLYLPNETPDARAPVTELPSSR